MKNRKARGKRLAALLLALAAVFVYACGANEPPPDDDGDEVYNTISVNGFATGSVGMKLSQQFFASAEVTFNITYEQGAEQGVEVSFTKDGKEHATGIAVELGDKIAGSDTDYRGTVTATEYGEFMIKVALKADPTEFVEISASVENRDHPETLPQETPSAAAVLTYPENTPARTSMPTAHDPAIVYDEATEMYYEFQTGGERRKSADMVTWTAAGSFLSSTPSAVVSAGGASNSRWAPDVIKGKDGKWWAYYASSTINTNNSVIALAKADNITDSFVHDSIIVTTKTNQPPNAIDPSVKYDKKTGKLWMVYGSFFGGVFLKELDPETGRALGASFGKNLVSGIDVEGPYIVYNEEFDYWYLFMAYGDMNKNYNTRVARSRDIEGPYLDAEGKDMAQADKTNSKEYGVKLEGNFNIDGKVFRAAGHNSVLDDTAVSGKWYHVAHNTPSGSYLLVRQMYFMPSGWPVFNINEYAGEDSEQAVNKLNMPGTYKSLFHVRGSLIDDDTSHRPMDLTIGADGTLSGSVTYNADPTDYEYRIAVEGTWEMRGTNKIEMLLTKAEVKLVLKADGTVVEDYDYSGAFFGIATPAYSYQSSKAALSFSAINAAGICFAGNMEI
ncbi:MAG: arabinan endo-1,5-alpha-L-arabinosidase [Clostridiales bacterium]|jgi:arabinan endo-1,5-alpha-L-arabinosidase|nr:arabinan endo-1,5-alpha-L-arabinosidase [Clostridiales bacterium]